MGLPEATKHISDSKIRLPWDGPTRGMCARTFELVKIATFLQQLWYKNL